MGYVTNFVNGFPNNAVVLQVVSGNNQSCSQNHNSHFNGLLSPGGSPATVDIDDPVLCYRRSADPENPNNGQFTNWVSVFPDNANNGQTIDVSLI
jgi:hypothetical protein